ncbi:ficolin-2 [Plakobranchus ocellatus]|uniref:Ficolin-2 n=1 Tax=Plakobranchus ocellatus TaxID=259542 RepID=A0AAV4DDX4_9GAST|nr:ficolin-2 [Plakobranchus ocellatus]
MKNELFTTAALILICFNACCEGINLVLNRDIQVVGSRITCGILLCEEKLTQTNIPSSSIFNMTVFKNQPICPKTPEDESETRVLVASINSKDRNNSRLTDDTRAFGLLGSRNASLRIEMFKPDDCRSSFTCEVQGLDSQGRSFLSTTTLLQQQGDNHKGYEILANSLKTFKDKVEGKIESVFTGVRNQVQSLEIEMNSLEKRLEDKMDAKLSVIKNQVQYLENRMEDKIDAKVSAIKNQEQSLENRTEDKIDEKLSAFKNQVQSLENSLDDEIDEKLSVIKTQVQSLENIMENKIDAKLSAIKADDTHDRNEAALFKELLLRMSRSMVSNLISSIVDIMQPSTCKKGMIRPSSSYPYPYPVIYPRDESGQGLPYLCDMFTDGGGWIVIQRRTSLFNVDFDRNWDYYKRGFGTLDDEFWLGNERIHAFTSKGTWELRIDLKYKGKEAYVIHRNFKLESELEQFTLRIGKNSGDKHSLEYYNGKKFSTNDRDNDLSKNNCARMKMGGWCEVLGLTSHATLAKKDNPGQSRPFRLSSAVILLQENQSWTRPRGSHTHSSSSRNVSPELTHSEVTLTALAAGMSVLNSPTLQESQSWTRPRGSHTHSSSSRNISSELAYSEVTLTALAAGMSVLNSPTVKSQSQLKLQKCQS